mmetsp:Transcript_21491/g.43527  ORF Transcript_21491/g.43527 Transcript_21491/m.43527 type:complete len:187 (-) Transcript_21491:116-676(-)
MGQKGFLLLVLLLPLNLALECTYGDGSHMMACSAVPEYASSTAAQRNSLDTCYRYNKSSMVHVFGCCASVSINEFHGCTLLTLNRSGLVVCQTDGCNALLPMLLPPPSPPLQAASGGSSVAAIIVILILLGVIGSAVAIFVRRRIEKAKRARAALKAKELAFDTELESEGRVAAVSPQKEDPDYDD